MLQSHRMYTASATGSPSCDEVTSQSEERYSFWRESNRFADYHTQTATHELMTSSQQQQQQRRRETSVHLTTSHRFKCSLLHCVRCLRCNQQKDAVVSVERAAGGEVSAAQPPENGVADKRPSQHPHRGRKIARTTADRNNSGAWRPDTASLITTGRETYIAATAAQHFKLNADERMTSSSFDTGSWPSTMKRSPWTSAAGAGVEAHQMVMLDYRPPGHRSNTICVHRTPVELLPRMNTTMTTTNGGTTCNATGNLDLLPVTTTIASPVD